MNSTESQRSNLRIKPVAANLPVTQKNTIISAAQSTVTTAIASRTRLPRRDRDLPLHTARPRIKRAKHIKCHKFGCPVNNYTLDDKGSFKYKHIKYHNVSNIILNSKESLVNNLSFVGKLRYSTEEK